MASRFRRYGIRTVGICAGAALAAWTFNPFSNKPIYNVSVL